jgi:hypothetical protein
MGGNKNSMFFVGLGCLFFLNAGFKKQRDYQSIPIYFSEYKVEVEYIPALRDTFLFNNSSMEDFKFVFYDKRGKCYCERYLNKILVEKGNYENSLDTLKRYHSTRKSNGSAPLSVEKYFQPVRNGMWIFYKGKNVIKKNYKMGVLQ